MAKPVGSRLTYKENGKQKETKDAVTKQEERKADTLNKNEKYREFSDRTDDGWDFDSGRRSEGGKEQVDFMNRTSNYNELIDKMSGTERNHFRKVWAPGYFMWGQKYGKFSDMDTNLQDATRTFDKYLDQAENREGFIVRRLGTAELVLGAGDTVPRSLEQLQALKGRVVTSKGSMSTSLAAHGLPIAYSIASSGKKMEYEIRIPGKSKGAGMWIGDKRINGWGTRQREFMTNRDSSFVIGDTRYDASRGVYVTQLTWVGHEKHSYD